MRKFRTVLFIFLGMSASLVIVVATSGPLNFRVPKSGAHRAQEAVVPAGSLPGGNSESRSETPPPVPSASSAAADVRAESSVAGAIAALSKASTSGPLQPTAGSPSIGTVKVLGQRGCDVNTQGWYLGVGNPEQYEFTVSDDGETVFVEPKVPNLSGAFEFVHCVAPGEIAGKRVRFTAELRAEGVTGLAQLHLRGETAHRERILYEETKFSGTFGQKQISVEAEVAPEVAIFNYGMTFRSEGRVWISHPHLGVTP